jgi:hypothetical protein
MELLKKIKRVFRGRAGVQQLPAGSLTVDRNGLLVTSTISSAYPQELLGEIGRETIVLFREARAAQMPLAELSLNYGSLIITARELRGGAVIFLAPQSATVPTAQLKLL